jgi:crotonobetainyl-CoA:carnitine CoA-transferase CaiB-like acyl-CoA transferase
VTDRPYARLQCVTPPLDGIRVVEVDNWGFAPSAGAVLADWGADVVKVEPPGRGDPLRAIFGTLNFGESTFVNFMHEQWNRNKRSIAVDLTARSGRAVLDQLVRESDVFLTNYLPDLRAKLQITPADVRRVQPDIVYALATGQGSKGPDADRPSYDYVSAWARAGVGERLTPEGAPFIQQRAGIVDTPAGNFLAGAIAAALLRRARVNEPVDVEVSLLAAGGWIIGPDITFALNNGMEMPLGRPDGRGAGPLFTWYECGDGRRLVFTMMQPERYWPEVARVLELDALLTDARFDTPEKRMAETDALCAVLADRIRTRPRAEWAARFDAADIIWAPVQSPNEYVDDVQVVANGYVLDAPRADGSITRVASSPAQFDQQPITARRAAPDLGQHTDEVLTELGWDRARIAAARAAGVVG